MALSDDDLVDFLRLARGADTVELKMTIPLERQRTFVEVIGLDPLDAQIRLVSFFDTPELELEQAGVVVRARRTQGRGDDTVVKLRPVEPDQVEASTRRSNLFGVEVDATPSGYVCSASFKGGARKTSVKEVATGAAPLRKLFSKDQRAFYADNAPEHIGLDDLTLLGPIFVLKLKGTPPGYQRKLVLELWLYPDGTRIAELSTKCAPREAVTVAAQTRVFLLERGLDLSADSETKTRAALEYFSAALV